MSLTETMYSLQNILKPIIYQYISMEQCNIHGQAILQNTKSELNEIWKESFSDLLTDIINR